MTEEYSPDNLISKTERFLSNSVYKSLRESIKALKACESISILAELLGITEQCVKSIVSRASSADPSLFGWPVNDDGGGGGGITDLQVSKSTDARRKRPNMDSWFEDLTQLSLPVFRNVILSMRSGNLRTEIIESCLISYAKKHIPGISRSNRKPPSSSSSENKQRVTRDDNLKSSIREDFLNLCNHSIPLRFITNLYHPQRLQACRDLLDRKIGSELE